MLLWITSKYCPESVRKRVVYIEPSREDAVMGFNPLLHETQQHGYYKVARATEIILRAWESVNIEAMPRLARWTFNAFWAAAQLGLTIADSVHFLMPGSDYHRALLNLLPSLLQAEWREIMQARGGEATRILESSRNRLKPYFEAPILRRMFGTVKSQFDALRFMKEGRIVLLNLAPQNRLSQQLGDAIGALVINEVLSTARSLPLGVRYPTYMLLDEFQNFVGPDLEAALPEVRQLGIRLILSHQSFSQLERGEYDLTSMIWQAQSRIAFGLQGEDADVLGHELASLTYDPKRIKDTMYMTRQRLAGHEKIVLTSWGTSRQEAQRWDEKHGTGWTRNTGKSKRDTSWEETKSEGSARVENEQKGSGGSTSAGSTRGQAEHLVPIHEEVQELSNRTFYSGDEWDRMWSKRARKLPTGVALIRLVNDDKLYKVSVERSAIGHLGWDAETLRKKLPRAIDDVEAFVERNFQSEFFVAPESIERETLARLQLLTAPAAQIGASEVGDVSEPIGSRRMAVDAPAGKKDPFENKVLPG